MNSLFYYYIRLFTVMIAVNCGIYAKGLVSLTPPPGWTEVTALAPGSAPPRFPTVKYIPKDRRNAALLVTILGRGNGSVSDLTALKKLHLQLCQQYLASPTMEFSPKELKFEHGVGVYASFEDPDLIGKPTKAGNYKMASPVALLLDGGVVAHATIFSDEANGPTFQEALDLLKSINLRDEPSRSVLEEPTGNGPIVISVPELDAELLIPRAGLSQASTKLNTAPSYFSYTTKDGSMMSGWLEPISKYRGLRQTWSSEKEKMESELGIKCEDESFQTIDGWQTVLYIIRLPGGAVQQNLRACRTYGTTWVDVHLSKTAQTAEKEPLKVLLRSLVIRSKGPHPTV